MAVQAQYPSNVLLLNRNGNREEDYSLHPQPRSGEMLLRQSHMIIHNINEAQVLPRKRPREASGGPPPPLQNPNMQIAHQNINNLQSFPLQSQPHQLIETSTTTATHPPPTISTGLHLSSSQHSYLTPDLASLVKQHRDDLHHFLLSQGEELRRTLAEKTQRHYRALLGATEESVTRRLREKDAEVEKATRRHAELESRAAQLSMEVQLWQAKARAQEIAAAALQAQLQQAIAGASPEKKSDDGGVEAQAEDAESAYVDPDRVTAVTVGGNGGGPGCRYCGRRVARVVVLPCRHLCLCAECDKVVQSCPVCCHVRNSSVEVLLC